MLNAIQFPCLMVCSITMFGRLNQFCTKLFNNLFCLQMLSKSLVGLLLIAIPFFHNKCQIQTSVLMSRAIHEAISSCLFQDLSIVKKHVEILECYA